MRACSARIMTDIAWERLSTMLESGMAACTVAQWRESGTDHEAVPLQVDWARYQAMEDAGVLKLISARQDHELIGYGAYFISPSLMYATTPHVLCDSIYVRPEHRGIAPAIIRVAERLFRGLLGSRTFRLIYSAQLNSGFPVVLERLGYPARESVHVKLITA